MADESCVFPGEPSRTSGPWLDHETAERLLSGTSPEVLDDTGADDRAAVLARTLRALAADGPVSDGELPGEAAAVAAFRRSRSAQVRAPLPDPAPEPRAAGRRAAGSFGARTAIVEAEPVRIGAVSPPAGPRWARPVRFGLAATLAGCMLGGVAVAGGAGLLPFGGSGEPGPAVSVSEAASPERPLSSPTPGPTESGGQSSHSPVTDDPSHTPVDGETEETGGPDGGPVKPSTGHDHQEDANQAENWWQRLVTACRDYRGGKNLDDQGRRDLEDAAHGSGRVKRFCDAVLDEENDSGGPAHETGEPGSSSQESSPNAGQNHDADRGGDDGPQQSGDAANDHHGESALVTPMPSEDAPEAGAAPLTTEGVTFSGTATQ